MNNLTLKQLRYFEALATYGHFGLAAEASNISQPALSMQIKELEETLGVQLVERGARHIRLTPFGEQALERAREILRSVDELGDLARVTGRQMTPRLRLGIIPTIAPYLLPRIVGQLTRDYPMMELNIRETLTPKLMQELSEGRIDTAILALPISEPMFEEVAIFDETFVLVRPEGDRDLPVPSPERLREMRLLLLEEGHCFRDQALAFCSIGSARPREMLDGSSLSTLVQMVGAGIGVTLIPQMAVGVETRSANVCVTHFAAPEPKRTIGMIWRKSNPMAEQFRAVADCVKLAVGRVSLGESGDNFDGH